MSYRARTSFILGLLAALTGAARAETNERPYSELPYTPSLDVTAMDRSVNPCADLYRFSCGGWQKNNPIPSDQASWSVYGKAYADNQRYLWGLLEQDAAGGDQRNPTQRLIGDYFAACMDSDAIENAGLSPLAGDLQRIDALGSKTGMGRLLAELQLGNGSSGFFFSIGPEQDAKESERVIGGIGAGGIGLPDRDYYVNDDERSREVRQRYRAHIERMFTLYGESPDDAARSAAAVMRIETALARASLTRVEQRDPYNLYHRTTAAELPALAPGIDWQALQEVLQLQTAPWLNVAEPAHLKEVAAIIAREPLADLQRYLRWALLDVRARQLPQAFVSADFDFYQAFLRGVPQQPPRWKTCVALVDQQLGEALGREFVERNFPPEVHERITRMTQQIEHAMRSRIEALDWMSPQTRAAAIAKLQTMRNKIGHPAKWRDYSTLQLRRDDFFGNVRRATEFETRRQLATIGKPLDRDEWFMSPATVNAYYDAQMNDINFPAGVLMPPLFDPRLDDAPNYGNTGATIGHELTHGFDDEGRKFDSAGNLRNWWTKADAERFEHKADCIREQYADYVIVDEVHINSNLTAGEDIADLGGLILAWQAWQQQALENPPQPRDGLTPEQRFFVGFGQWACANARPEDQRVRAITDAHSPPKYRINGVVANMPEFARAFSCSKGDALYRRPKQICEVW